MLELYFLVEIHNHLSKCFIVSVITTLATPARPPVTQCTRTLAMTEPVAEAATNEATTEEVIGVVLVTITTAEDAAVAAVEGEKF